MGYDTTYRPRHFEDVIGQDATVKVLQSLLESGDAFKRSYVFAGPSGTGKTTLARILARAMLCEAEGALPCDTCNTCKAFLAEESLPVFRELDAANHSGAENIRAIVASLNYYVVGGGSRVIYLIDEAHRLSAQAMDALLKPMEDVIPGTSDKRLVCLFCTTEPHKLRGTIKGRSMVFTVKPPDRDAAVSRLTHICEKEAVAFSEEALGLIFDYGKGHVRDMVTALERVTFAGDVSVENVRSQLGLGVFEFQARILLSLREDPVNVLDLLGEAQQQTDVATVYGGIAEVAMAACRLAQGVDTGLVALDKQLLSEVVEHLTTRELVQIARHVTTERVQDLLSAQCELLYLRDALVHGTLGQTGKVVVVHSEGVTAPVPTSAEASAPQSEAQYEAQNRKYASHVSRFGSVAARGRPELEAKEDPMKIMGTRTTKKAKASASHTLNKLMED